MNWGRGLSRIWIVLTAAWIAVVVALAIQDFAAPKPSLILHDGQQQIEFPAGTSRAVVERALTGYVKEARASSPYAAIGTPVETVEKEVARIAGDYRPPSKLKFATGYAALALMPPFLVLAAGIAVVWVGRDFRSEGLAGLGKTPRAPARSGGVMPPGP